MGYLHIDNLYKNTTVTLFRKLYALEKIHGTSAHVRFNDGKLNFHPGGIDAPTFKGLFNVEELEKAFKDLGQTRIIVYGEAYGGKINRQSNRYGPDIRFVAFDVKINDYWLNVDDADKVVTKLGLQFVPYKIIPSTLYAIDDARDEHSIQANRNGVEEPQIMEGVVLRPLVEFSTKGGKRVIAKHKREEFHETRTPRKVDPAKLKVLKDAQSIAEEWVTPMRLNHVLDKLDFDTDITRTKEVISAMVEDVKREAEGEIVFNGATKASISRTTALLYKKYIKDKARLEMQPLDEDSP